jgi:hypothetical protein
MLTTVIAGVTENPISLFVCAAHPIKNAAQTKFTEFFFFK